MRSISFRTRASSYSSTFPLIPASTVSNSTIFCRRVSLLASSSCNWYFLPAAGSPLSLGRRSPAELWIASESPAPSLRSQQSTPAEDPWNMESESILYCIIYLPDVAHFGIRIKKCASSSPTILAPFFSMTFCDAMLFLLTRK